MEFVVASHSFLVRIEVAPDFSTQDFQILHRGHHYGVAVEDRAALSVYAAERDVPELQVYRRVSSGRDLVCQETVPLPHPPVDIHQLCMIDGTLLVANTGENSIDSFDPGAGTVVRLRIDGKDFDTHHVNSLFCTGPREAVALLHNNGHRLSQLFFFERCSDGSLLGKNRVNLWHERCHNVFSDGRVLVYNSSFTGELVVIDLVAQRPVAAIHIGGHTKGLAVTDKYYVVGSSEFARRAGRRVSRGRICFIDRSTLEVVGETDLNAESLPHPIGNVNEIRCLSPGDESQRSASRPASLARLRLASRTPWPALRFAWLKRLRRWRGERLYK